jgi:hypothetical protein
MDIVPEAEPVYLKAYDPVRGRFPLSSGSGILSPSVQGPTRASGAGPGVRLTSGTVQLILGLISESRI